MSFFDFVWTLSLFVLTLCILPFVALCYISVQGFRALWLYILVNSYEKEGDLEFVKQTTIRSILDTRRNQGIFSFLVSVHGQCQPAHIRKTLFEIVGRRDKCGRLLYPRLQQTLVSIWGCYAWKKQCNYQLDKNFTVGHNIFRGRPVSEHNLQEYISTIVAKYFPQDISPWQIVIIPNVTGASDQMYYILLRIHHILLSEEKTLRISDLLMIKQTYPDEYYPTHHHQISAEEPKSPLLDVFETPKAIPELYKKLTEDFANRWNEFISIYDPLENVELLKTTPTLYQFSCIFTITLITILYEYKKDYNLISNDIHSKCRYLMKVIYRETDRRQLTFKLFLESLLLTINPKTIIFSYVAFIWRLFIYMLLKLPLLIYYEIFTLFECLNLKECSNQNTVIAFLYYYVPLFYAALKEIIYCLCVIIQAPKYLINEFFVTKFYASPQTIKLCGRKVVSWTKKLNKKTIRTIGKQYNITDTEVLFGTIGAAITEFLIENRTPVPEHIPIIARNIHKTYLYANNFDSKPLRHDIGGVVCLNLPLVKNRKQFNWNDYLRSIHKEIERARNNQASIYGLTKLQTNRCFLTKCLPSVIIKVVLNYLSRIYTVAITEMTTEVNEKKYKTTLWGSEINNIIYWRPIQANISLSLSLSCYADNITLAVMSDALLSPAHVTLRKEFTYSLNQLIENLNIPTTSY